MILVRFDERVFAARIDVVLTVFMGGLMFENVLRV
jgi:hypothetical protein